MSNKAIEAKVGTLIALYDVLDDGPESAGQAGRMVRPRVSDSHRWIGLLEHWGLVKRILHDGHLAFRTQRKLSRTDALRLIGRHATDPIPRLTAPKTRQRPRAQRNYRPKTESRAIRAAKQAVDGSLEQLFGPNEPASEDEVLEFLR